MARYVVGIEKLLDRLQQLHGRLKAGTLLRRSMRNAAKFVMGKMKEDTPRVTGVLQSQYRVRALKRSRKRWGYTVRVIPRSGQRWYASFVNYGWFARPVGPRFMNKAIDREAGEALGMVVEGVKQEIAHVTH